MPAAREMAAHLLTLPPASRVNTLTMMRAMRPRVPDELEQLAARLRDHGAKDDLMESRRAFAEKRTPHFKGWDEPGGPLPHADVGVAPWRAAGSVAPGRRSGVHQVFGPYRADGAVM